MSFKSKLIVEVDIKGELRTLVEPLIYKDWTIPKGFVTNYGSVPQILQSFIPASGKATYAYVLHDWLYETGILSKDEADKLLRDLVIELGLSKIKAYSIYYGLKIGGFKAWNKCRENDVKLKS